MMEDNTTKKYAVKTKKLPHSQIEITASIPADEFGATRSAAIKRIGADVELPGFRKGHAPENIIVAKIGEASVLEEMAELAIAKAYGAIIEAEKLDVLGRPEVRITKIAMGNPLEFTLTTAIFPDIKLPDYKKISAKSGRTKEDVAVTDEEVEKAVGEIRAMHTERMAAQKDGGATEEKAEGPIDDAFVKTLGDFADVADFKAKLRENITQEKERSAKDKRRVAIIDAILAKTDLDLPEIVLEQELARLKEEFAHDVQRMGLTMDAYLKAVKKTPEEMEKEWRPTAEKRAKTQLIVSHIAEAEKIAPDPETLKKEVAALRAHYPDAKEAHAENYLRTILTNEKVFQLLESQE